MAKTNLARYRSEQAKLVTAFRSEAEAIRNSFDANTADIIANKLVRIDDLAAAKADRAQRILDLNQRYVAATQDVLDDQTLQFLVDHSKIDAPTLTSIFAGFELARASAAKRGKLLVDAETTASQQQDAIDTARTKQLDAVENIELGLEKTAQAADLGLAKTDFSTQSAATNNDIAAQLAIEKEQRVAVRAEARRQQTITDKAASDAAKKTEEEAEDAKKKQEALDNFRSLQQARQVAQTTTVAPVATTTLAPPTGPSTVAPDPATPIQAAAQIVDEAFADTAAVTTTLAPAVTTTLTPAVTTTAAATAFNADVLDELQRQQADPLFIESLATDRGLDPKKLTVEQVNELLSKGVIAQ